MFFKKTVSICIALALVFVGQSFADKDNDDVGTSVFNFLKLENGARPIAMGGAFTGLADDENALVYNPAGITSLKGRHFIGGYFNNVFDMQSGFLGYTHQLDSSKYLGLQISYLNYGDFIATDNAGEVTGSFGGSDIMFAGTFATSFGPSFQVGLTGKYIYEKIDTYASTGLAFDLGARYIINRDRYTDSTRASVGIMIQNVGTHLSTYVDGGEKYSLPAVVRAGFAGALRELPIIVAADVIKPFDNDIYFAFGAELIKIQPLFIRVGYSTFGSNYKTESGSDGLAGFTAGFGVTHKNMEISYSITPEAELGTSHRITFTGGIK